MHLSKMHYITAVIMSCIVSIAANAQGADTAATRPVGKVLIENLEKGVPFPDEGDSVVGDHLILRNHVIGLYLPWDDKKTQHCAAKDSRFQVDGDGRIKFFSLPLVEKDGKHVRDADGHRIVYKPAICKDFPMVQIDVKYIGDEGTLDLVEYKRTGAAFGTLVVPFKFRLGSEKRLVSSSTIAPYVGWRHRKLQGLGLSLMPVVAGGLALVPIKDIETGETETKAGLSLATGVTLTSSKNRNFSAGLLLGWDYLSKNERRGDATVQKPWISFWLGING